LRQVLINLLGNAVKFTDAGGVTLRISEGVNKPMSPSSNSQMADSRFTFHVSRFMFEVIDTGIGISPQDQPKLFDPFYQGQAGVRKGGTGLGLAISKRQIELMGGKLELESPLPPIPGGKAGGHGGRFYFTLPLLPAATAAVAVDAMAWRQVTRLADGYPVKAVVADDSKVNRDVLSNFLSGLGVDVRLAENGEQAVEMVRTDRPDILFLDIRMPIMDGLTAAEQLRAEYGRGTLKIVAVSASALQHEAQTYLDTGFDDFIAKPFRFERVCECLATQLGVAFETEASAVGGLPETALPALSLPKALVEQMKTAAELYKVTELRKYLAQVEALGSEGQRLAEQLREQIRDYDMEAVLKVLSESFQGQ